MDKNNIKIYLASPLGFSESTFSFMNKIEEELENLNFNVLNPWKLCSVEDFKEIDKIEDPKLKIEKLKILNYKIGERNEQSILDSDLIIAILDGVDVDSGTASEIGYACAKRKMIYGYRNDFRQAGENLGSIINIQVEYWIKKNGGKIFLDLDEMIKYFKIKYKK